MLLSRLENMLENSLHTNLLLTGLLAQLAAHPQPLLRHFLLDASPSPSFQPTTHSLYQVRLHCPSQGPCSGARCAESGDVGCFSTF